MNKVNPPQQQITNLLRYYQSGQYDSAEDAAISITEQFPEYQFAWKILGALLGQRGMNIEALNANQKAVQIVPQDAEAHNNLGLTLHALDRLESAEASYRKAIDLKSDLAEAHNNLGITLHALGRIAEAEANYKKAINLGADFAEVYNNLGTTFQELGRLSEAEVSYKKSIELNPNYAEPLYNLGNALKELGRREEAEVSLRQALAIIPDYAKARYNLGVLLFGAEQYDLAAEQFDLVDILQSKSYIIRCSYLQDDETIFFEKLNTLIDQGERDAVIGSLSCSAEIRYRVKNVNPFCNKPLNYVVKTDLKKQYDFDNIFTKTAREVLMDKAVSLKAQGHLTNGVQTAGNIFAMEKVSATAIESIIRAEIEKYRINFEHSDEGFIKYWPASYDIFGWIIRMQSGGELAAHMHDNGWITGSVYINVPPKSNNDSGNLVLCMGDKKNVLGADKEQESIIDVVTGSLCFFPSSLRHYTVPFEEEEDRIVLAFDVVPRK